MTDGRKRRRHLAQRGGFEAVVEDGRFLDAVRPELLWDRGCNTGAFCEPALEHGARHVIGFDCDHGAMEKTFRRASEGRLDFPPLFLDAANPSPDQGWRRRERRGFPGAARPTL